MGVGLEKIEIIESFNIIYETINDIIEEGFNPGEIIISVPQNTDKEILERMYNTVEVGEFTPPENKEDKNEDELNKLLNQGRSFFLLDHLWGENDQMDRLIKEGKWIHTKWGKYSDIKYIVQIGDILLGKQTFPKYLLINAIGIVKQNPEDRYALNVNWYKINPVEIPEPGDVSDDAITQIEKGFEIIIITKLYRRLPNLFEIINELDSTVFKDKVKPEKDKDKIPFHLDQVVQEDKLGREPVAKAFVNLIKKDVFTEKLNHSFMVHLQGEWGAGKSSFLNFISKNLNTEGEKWIVVNYNAWQNQHISPPWWTLIDQIYRQSESQLTGYDKYLLWRKENYRRMIWYSGWQKALALLLTIGFTILIIAFGSSILEVLANKTVSSKNVTNATPGLTIDVFAKLLITLGSAIGVIYSFSKFITTPFIMKSSSEAVSFMSRASDPMTRIKSHFSNLVDNINSKEKKRQLAIFIDDIDRCNKEFIVHLLEGIQTLFKDKRVLYIIAGDKRWITTSFGNAYKEFSSDGSKSDELGELFLEKAFQLSFRMPNVEEGAKKEYWNYILGLSESKTEEAPKIDSFEKLTKDQQTQVKKAITNATDYLTFPDFMKQMEDEFNLTRDTVTDLIIKEKNSDAGEIRHLLKDFHSVIDANPRSIIRLANNYTMTRSTLIAERKDISADKIFRWLVIEDLYPKIKLVVSKLSSIDDIKAIFEKEISAETLKNDCINLLIDEKKEKGGSFDIEEIKDIIGL